MLYDLSMVSFSQAKDMFRLQREAKKVKKELRNIHVEAEASKKAQVVSAEKMQGIMGEMGMPTGG